VIRGISIPSNKLISSEAPPRSVIFKTAESQRRRGRKNVGSSGLFRRSSLSPIRARRWQRERALAARQLVPPASSEQTRDVEGPRASGGKIGIFKTEESQRRRGRKNIGSSGLFRRSWFSPIRARRWQRERAVAARQLVPPAFSAHKPDQAGDGRRYPPVPSFFLLSASAPRRSKFKSSTPSLTRRGA